LLQRLVRPVTVAVPRVLGQDLAEVLLAEDQHVVQALAAEGSHEPFREGVRPWRPDRGLDHPRAVPGEDLIERRRELAVPGHGSGTCCDTRSHVVSELVEEVWLMPVT
jgi:hypothetical protein